VPLPSTPVTREWGGKAFRVLICWGIQKWLMIAGLTLTLVGAGFGFWGVWVDEDQALGYGQIAFPVIPENKISNCRSCRCSSDNRN
jgi:hypothetical protein